MSRLRTRTGRGAGWARWREGRAEGRSSRIDEREESRKKVAEGDAHGSEGCWAGGQIARWRKATREGIREGGLSSERVDVVCLLSRRPELYLLFQTGGRASERPRWPDVTRETGSGHNNTNDWKALIVWTNTHTLHSCKGGSSSISIYSSSA